MVENLDIIWIYKSFDYQFRFSIIEINFGNIENINYSTDNLPPKLEIIL